MKDSIDMAALRQSYAGQPLDASRVHADPLLQFTEWFEQALETGVAEPNAMTLATINASGAPSARVVLLKGVEDGGFVFFTNYKSDKGEQLRADPRAALVFWWEPLHRQVRIEGAVEQVSREYSIRYFQSRPRGSQIGAWASPQSRPVSDRAILTTEVAMLEEKYAGQDTLPCPPWWGGYLLRPSLIEFWQGQANRLHDRLRYSLLGDGHWEMVRLAP